jgi:hypothetical protein
LEGGSPGRILYADLVADIPYYIKIECKDGAVSPIQMSLEDTKARNGKLQAINVYGSFRMKEPTAEKNDFEYKDSSEIDIHEPRGRKIFAAVGTVLRPSNVEGEDPIAEKQHLMYYFCVIAKKNTRLKI